MRYNLSLVKTECSDGVVMYIGSVPKLWTETIDAHRRSVGEAILDATAALVAEQGLASVTMSAIADRTGIGRATLYKYYPDVEAILVAWHERQVTQHLRHLMDARDQAGDPGARLESVLTAYALIQHQHDGGDLWSLLHRGERVARAHQQLHDFIQDLISGAAATGVLRGDVPPGELAAYCLHALAAARGLRSRAAVRRLVTVVLSALRPQP